MYGMISMIKSDPKLSPKVDDVNAEKPTEPIVKTNSSAKSVKAI
jgi:hypothetical protein